MLSGPSDHTRHAHSWETSSSGPTRHRGGSGTESATANACGCADGIHLVLVVCAPGAVVAGDRNHCTRRDRGRQQSPPSRDAGTEAAAVVSASASGKGSGGARVRVRGRFAGGMGGSASACVRAFVGGACRTARL